MPELPRRRRSRRLSRGWLVLGAITALAIAAPVAVLASAAGATDHEAVGQVAPRPGESCPDATPAPGSSDFCNDTTPTNGGDDAGLDLGALIPFVVAAAAGGVLALIAAFVVLGRRGSAPLAPVDPGEWWTCHSCGKTNVVGSPRCYACGTWQG